MLKGGGIDGLSFITELVAAPLSFRNRGNLIIRGFGRMRLSQNYTQCCSGEAALRNGHGQQHSKCFAIQK